ncbi:hypothetical protein JADG_005204 [Aureobasidium aubasidani]|nr:hypothetical protein JADG_005204 [Aureobasidium pullulans]
MLEDKPQHDGEDSGHVSSNHDASEKSSSGQPFSNSWRDEPLTPTESAKVTQILRACENKDTQQIVALATTSGGLIEDHVRRVACTARESENQIEGRKHELSNLITGLLRQHPCLHYFQGFHDIAQVLLLVLGANQAAPLLARLSLLRIRDYMLPTFSASESHHLSGLQPYFAIAATLTLYAHDIEEYGGISRLFDFLLAHEAVVSVYMYATIIMLRKDELLELGSDEEDMMYAILSKLPKPLDIESLITRTTLLYSQHPPETLPFRAWRQVSGYSVLKTTRDPNELAKQTLKDGEQLYAKHAAQIERQQALQKAIAQSRLLAYRYRKPAGALTVAVAVGVLSLYIGKSGNGSSVSSSAILLDAKHKLLWVINRAWAALRL